MQQLAHNRTGGEGAGSITEDQEINESDNQPEMQGVRRNKHLLDALEKLPPRA
jgi:hypothetical protein